MAVDILVWNVRDKKHMTLRQLSSLSGISNSEISRIENGFTHPTLEAMCSLARALQVPVTDLFEDINGIKA